MLWEGLTLLLDHISLPVTVLLLILSCSHARRQTDQISIQAIIIHIWSSHSWSVWSIQVTLLIEHSERNQVCWNPVLLIHPSENLLRPVAHVWSNVLSHVAAHLTHESSISSAFISVLGLHRLLMEGEREWQGEKQRGWHGRYKLGLSLHDKHFTRCLPTC